MGDSLELIGKRLFLLLGDGGPASVAEPEQAVWARDWLRGTVRAVSVIGLAATEVTGEEAATTTATTTPTTTATATATASTAAAGLTVFVEFENTVQRYSWVQVYGEGVRAILVEDSIVWANRSDGSGPVPGSANAWPALAFRSLVDRVGLGSLVPVEFFGNRSFEFLSDNKFVQRFEVDKDLRHSLLLEHPSLQAAISSWLSDFELQEIFRKEIGSFCYNEFQRGQFLLDAVTDANSKTARVCITMHESFTSHMDRAVLDTFFRISKIRKNNQYQQGQGDR